MAIAYSKAGRSRVEKSMFKSVEESLSKGPPVEKIKMKRSGKAAQVIDKRQGKDPWGGKFGVAVQAVDAAAKNLKTLKTPVSVREPTPVVRRERRKLVTGLEGAPVLPKSDPAKVLPKNISKTSLESASKFKATPFVNKQAAKTYKGLRADPNNKVLTDMELKTIANDEYGVKKSMFKSVENSMFKGVLSTEDREDLKEKQFALPKKAEDKEEKAESGNYPIPDLSHARNALAMVAQHGTPAEQAQVRAAVHKKYPELDNQTDEESKMDKSLPSTVDPARAAAINEPIISRGNTTRRQVAEHMAKSFNTGAPVFVEEPFNGRLRKGVVIPKGQGVKEAAAQVASEKKGRVDSSGSKADLKAAIQASGQPATSKQENLLTKLKPVQSRTFKTVAPQQPGVQAPIVGQSSPARDEMIASMKAAPSNTQVATFIKKMGGYGGQLSGEAGANQTVKFGRSSAQKEFNNFTDAQKNQVWAAFKRGVKRTRPSATAKSPVVQKLREGLGLGQPKQVAPGKEVKPR
jgi:hypothetical protein